MTSNLLSNDHVEVGGLFKELAAALDSGNAASAFALLDLVWARIAVHIRAEHLCLFPAILDALVSVPNAENLVVTSGEAQRLIARLREDHNFFMNELAGAIKAMRELKAENGEEHWLAEVRQKVAEVAIRLDEHNKLEEERLYRWPTTLLSAAEHARLLARVQHEIENLPPRFR